MKVQVFQLMWKVEGDHLAPMDRELFELAESYARQYVTKPKPMNFLDYMHTWFACEVNDEGKPVRGLGLLSMVMRADFVVCRFSDNAATKKLVERASDFLHDQGSRGTQVLVHIAKDEPAEDRCPNYLDWMAAFGMKPADRYTFDIK